MNTQTNAIGGTTSTHRYPVKSMLGEDLTAAPVEPRGLAGDCVYALIDDESLPARLGEFFGRAVSISSSPPPDAHFDLNKPMPRRNPRCRIPVHWTTTSDDITPVRI